MRGVMQPLLCWIFSGIYRRWLWDELYQEYDKVEKVLGWRTARVTTKGGSKRCMTPCFWGLD